METQLADTISQQFAEALDLAKRIQSAPPLAFIPTPEEARALREGARLTRRALALSLGVDPSSIYSYERGATTPVGQVKLRWLQAMAALTESARDARESAAA